MLIRYTTRTMTKKKDFTNVMDECRDKAGKELNESLGMLFDMAPGGLTCPAPGCQFTQKFTRWGDLYDHFLDKSTHKRDYFQFYLDKRNEPFCGNRGQEFKDGVKALMLALLQTPTALPSKVKLPPKKSSTPIIEAVSAVTPERPRRVKPLQEQQTMLGEVPTPTQPLQKASEPPMQTLYMQVAEQAKYSPETVEAMRYSPPKSHGKKPFTKVCELIRDSDEISKVWRGKVWDEYVEMFHGFAPCFHCRVEEATQIHHQNPLFHEIVLLSLKKLGISAEKIVEDLEGKEITTSLKTITQEVYEFHMKQGRVCAVPYCRNCNMDAETKRRRGRQEDGEN